MAWAVASAPRYSEVAGFFTAGFRKGRPCRPFGIMVDVENVTDKSYRGISWGVDAPGFGVAIRYSSRF